MHSFSLIADRKVIAADASLSFCSKEAIRRSSSSRRFFSSASFCINSRLDPWRVIWRDRRGSEPEARGNLAGDGENPPSPRVSSRGVIAADIFVRRVLAADVDFTCAASVPAAAIGKDDQCEPMGRCSINKSLTFTVAQPQRSPCIQRTCTFHCEWLSQKICFRR